MKRIVLLLLALAACIYALVVFWGLHKRAAGLDFYIYYVASQLPGRADVDNIYADEVQSRIGEEYHVRALESGSEIRIYDSIRRRRLDNVSSPFLYTTLRWVSRDYDLALMQYHIVVLCAFIAGVLLLARRAGASLASSLFLLAGLLRFFNPFHADLRVGNVNSLQLLACGLYVWSPPLLGGAILGLLVSFKPNFVIVPALLLVARIASREWKRLRLETIGGAIGIVAAFVAASINFGSPRVWLQWITAANLFWHRIPTRAERNVTPALSWFVEHGTIVSYAIAAVLFALAAFSVWKRRSRNDTLVLGLAILVYLMSATVVWFHYLVLTIPVAVTLLRSRWSALIAIAALALMAEGPFEMLMKRSAIPIEPWLITPSLIALFVTALFVRADEPEIESNEPIAASENDLALA